MYIYICTYMRGMNEGRMRKCILKEMAQEAWLLEDRSALVCHDKGLCHATCMLSWRN